MVLPLGSAPRRRAYQARMLLLHHERKMNLRRGFLRISPGTHHRPDCCLSTRQRNARKQQQENGPAGRYRAFVAARATVLQTALAPWPLLDCPEFLPGVRLITKWSGMTVSRRLIQIGSLSCIYRTPMPRNWWRVRALLPPPRRCHHRALLNELTPRGGAQGYCTLLISLCKRDDHSMQSRAPNPIFFSPRF